MSETRVKNILNETLKNKYEENRFAIFLKELFNDIQINKFDYDNKFIPEIYTGYIKKITLLGNYTDENNSHLDLLAICLNKEISLNRARSMQRNFIAWYLKRVSKQSALVAFYSDEETDWRLSFVKQYSSFVVTDGRIKREDHATPVKRYSFLVGESEPNHTAQEKLKPLFESSKAISIEQLENAFEIESVTKEFYEKYKELFLELKEELDKILEESDEIRKEFEEKNIDTINFAKKLLGQIIFLYFLQKKGWLGVKKESDWGTGPKNFMKKLYNGEYKNYDNFYDELLEPLFYEALSSDRTDSYYSLFKCRIPFLNGGLFEPIKDYNWVQTKIYIDNKIFEKIFKTFDSYNFTVKEDEPLEKEVAVDPEMLGKIFENLLEVTDRKSKGAFYTPREIVNFMCAESLINYLETELKDFVSREDLEEIVKNGEYILANPELVDIMTTIKENAEIIDNKLENIRICDPAIGSGAFPLGMMNLVVRVRQLLTLFIGESEKRKSYNLKRHVIQENIYGVDLEPGAIEIAKLRMWLSLVVDEENYTNIKPLPNLDYKIMQGNSLIEEYHGVKLFDEGFVYAKSEEQQINELKEELVKLAVKEIHMEECPEKKEIEKKMKKISNEIKKLTDSIKDKKKALNINDVLSTANLKTGYLKEMHKKYIEETNRTKKLQIKKEIEKTEWELIELTLKETGKENELNELEKIRKNNIKPYFLWKLNFCEVFAEKGGFDIVIGNPPYVRQEAIKEFKGSLMNEFEVFNSTSDLYTYFYERGHKLLNQKGNLTFITSNKWMRAKYGTKLREYFIDKTGIKTIIDFAGVKVFETATVDTNILLLNKIQNKDTQSFKAYTFDNNYRKENDIIKYMEEKIIDLPINILKSENFILGNNNEVELKGKIERIGTPLKEWGINIYRGVLTGFNDAFIIDTETKERLCEEDPKSTEIIKPILRGRDINRYSYNWSNNWIIFIPWHFPLNNKPDIKGASNEAELIFEHEYPAIYKHIKSYKKELSNRNKSETGIRYEWYALQRCANTYYQEFEKEKIVWQRVTKTSMFSYVPNNMIIHDSMAFITGDINLKMLIGMLNSKVVNYYFESIAHQYGNTGFLCSNQYVEKLPLPKINNKKEEQIVQMVEKIITLMDNFDYSFNEKKQEKVKTYEIEIDKIVYELYQLTPEEIDIIEKIKR